MKSINSKLVLSVLGIALLASPAFAQRPHHLVRHEPVQAQNNPVGTYPNPVGRTGTEDSIRSGAASDLDRGY